MLGKFAVVIVRNLIRFLLCLAIEGKIQNRFAGERKKQIVVVLEAEEAKKLFTMRRYKN